MNHENAPKVKVLLCDAAFSAVPILEALKAKNFHVGVCGARSSDPCHLLADESFIFDYSDKDTLLSIVEENHFDYIVPGCTDVSYLASAWVANALGLPGFNDMETTSMIHNKAHFREFCRLHDYPIPQATNVLADAKKLSFPILIKPTDSFSGKGIEKADSLAEFDSAYKKVQAENPATDFLFEAFVDGKLFSHSAFIKDRKIVADFFVNEYCTVYPYQVNSSNLETRLNHAVKEKMRAWLELFAKEAGLCDGLVHTQFISDNEQLWLIEVARRCPGDLYSQLIRLSTGIEYCALYISGFCATDSLAENRIPRVRNFSRHTVSVSEDCIFMASTVALPNVKASCVQLKKSGEPMRAAPYDRSGIYFIEFESAEEMEHATEKLLNTITVEKLPPNNHRSPGNL